MKNEKTKPSTSHQLALWVWLSLMTALFSAGPALADAEIETLQAQVDALIDEVQTLKADSVGGGDHASEGVHFGGYGEMHLNITEGSGKDLIDLHRIVLFTGYAFNDWIQLHSELEIEHAFIHKEEGGGEVIFEQAYLELEVADGFHVRIGRLLAPLGIINHTHEPPTFHGVERPNFAKYLIPSTWSLDGIGVAGRVGDSFKYELNLTSSLDASGFSAKDGIRGGRQHERPGVAQPALSGRVDLYPGRARVGASFFAGGADNGNKGANPGAEVDFALVAADFDWSVWRIDLRGEWAYGMIDGTEKLASVDEEGNVVPSGVAEAIMGWYLEAALRVMPDSLKSGRLAESELAIFARYEDYDTQLTMPDGSNANPAGNRTEITLGVTFLPTPNVSLKADVQLPDDATDKDLDRKFNLGAGWAF